MSLRSLFGGKDDAVTLFKKELMETVKNGDARALDMLLEREIDAPPAILGAALQKTVAQGQLRLATRLLDAGAPLRDLSFGTVRGVVLEERKDMFRLLAERGLEFSRYISSSSSGGDSSYRARLRFMAKDLECDQLREEVAQLKTEITQLKETGTARETEHDPKPGKKQDKGLSL